MGKKFGWLLGAIVIVSAGAILAISLVTQSPSQPTEATLAEGVLDLHTIDLPITYVLPHPPSEPGNAGDDYSKAVESMHELGRFSLARVSDFRQVHRRVSIGAMKKEMRFTLVHTPDKFEVGYSYRPAEDLMAVYKVLSGLAMTSIDQAEFSQVRKILQDIFVLGHHMTGERGRVDMVRKGLYIQIAAVGGLVELHKRSGQTDKDSLARLKEYQRALAELRDFYDEKTRIVWTLSNVQPGDIFNVAVNDADRSFRVQAILYLGVLRYNAVTSSDAKWADKLIARFSGEDDPLIRAAAGAAAELTLEEFRTVATK